MANFHLGRKFLVYAALIGSATLALGEDDSSGQAYVFAFGNNGAVANQNVVTHVKGYNGTGGNINITVGIDPTSQFASEMAVSVQNVAHTWNGLVATTGNIQSNVLDPGKYDFESVLLHEMGHALGLAHVNMASESNLSNANQDYSKSGFGADGVFNLNAGADGIRGSADDVRGDDVNLNFFEKGVNNPFALNASGIFDSTTYSTDTSFLPTGDNYVANADRSVSSLYGVANTEAVMQQGTFAREVQRSLAASDVIAMRYAMSGLDELQGTADDYTYTLQYVGMDASADMVIDFDNSVGFAAASLGGIGLGSDHFAISSSNIRFNDGFDWHFNQVLAVPEPSSAALIACGGLLGLLVRRRR